MQAGAAAAALMQQCKIDAKVAATKAALAATGTPLTDSQEATVTAYFESELNFEENSTQQPLVIDIATAAAKALTLTTSQIPIYLAYALTLDYC